MLIFHGNQISLRTFGEGNSNKVFRNPSPLSSVYQFWRTLGGEIVM